MLRIVLQSLKIVTIGVMTLLVVAGGLRFFDYYLDRTQAADVGKTVNFRVREDETVDSVAKRLHDAGLIRYELYFETRVRAANADVIPGRYRLRKGMTANQIIDVLTGKREDVEEEEPQEEAKELQLTVIEGWRTEQIAEELVNLGWEGTVEDFMKAVEEFPTSAYAFLDSRDNPVNPNSLEGFLFPDTYTVRTNEPAADIIQKMLDNFDAKFTPQMRNRAEEMGLSIYDVLKFASLVEREAQLAEERPVIADVYINRFVDGWNMEADPTIRYAIGKRENGEWWDAVTAQELEEVDSPYNTYKNPGLPPGPICNPSLDSIQAVLTPAGTGYFFFVALEDDSGKHLFAYDKAGQDQNVAFVAGEAAEPAPGSDPFASGVISGGEDVPIQQAGG